MGDVPQGELQWLNIRLQAARRIAAHMNKGEEVSLDLYGAARLVPGCRLKDVQTAIHGLHEQIAEIVNGAPSSTQELDEDEEKGAQKARRVASSTARREKERGPTARTLGADKKRNQRSADLGEIDMYREFV